MAKILKAKRQITPTGRAGVERMPARPQPSRRVGAETQRLGQTLRGIGGAFGQLAGKLQEMQYDNDVLTAKNSLTTDYKTFTDDIAKDDNYAGREDKFYTWFDSTTKEYTTATKSQRAKQDLTTFFAGERTRMGIGVSAQAHRLLIQDTRIKSETWLTSTEQAWANAVTDEDRDFIEETVKIHLNKLDADDIYVDGWIEQRGIDFLTNAKKLAYDKLKKDAYQSTIGVLADAGIENAKEYVLDEKNFPGLLPDDRYNIFRRAERLEDYLGIEDAERMEAEEAALTNEMSEMLAKGVSEGRVLMDFIETLEEGTILKKTWKTIDKNLSKVPIGKETNYKKYIELEGKIFDVLTDKKLRKKHQEELAEARSTGDLSHDDYNTLLSRMKLDLSSDEISYLRSAFDTIKKQESISWRAPSWLGGRWSAFEAGRTSAEEAKSIAKVRTALLDWMQNRKDRKKETSLPDYLKESLHLIIAERKAISLATAEEWDEALMWMHWGDTALPREVTARVAQYRQQGWSSESIVKTLRDFPDPTKITVKEFDAAMETETKEKKPPAITATNPATGEKVISHDGGKTWQNYP